MHYQTNSKITSPKKILITGKLDPVFHSILDEQSPQIVYDVWTDIKREKLLEIVEPYHCIISRSETNIDQTLIDRAKNLEVIARAAVGVGNIDINYATSKGILVFNTPLINTNSAAELTLSLILACARKVVSAHNHMKANQWERHQYTGIEIKGKTVGIIGLGNVGSRVAKFLHAMDTILLSYDPYLNEDNFRMNKCTKVDLDELLAKSDIITLHVPKNKETINMIASEQIQKMKDGVLLINVARGGVVNEQALYDALSCGKIASVGIDTWDVEPVKGHPLKDLGNVTMTPHIGASTYEAQKNIAISVAKETINALKNSYVSNPVNLPKIQILKGSLARQYASLSEKLGLFIFQYIKSYFAPQSIEFLYRGEILEEDWGLIKIAFLKGYFSSQTCQNVSYVNALNIAESKNIKLIENSDKNFTDYMSAIRIKMSDGKTEHTIGGTIVGQKSHRLSYLDGMKFEVEPTGEILVIKNEDKPGVIGHVGKTLSKHSININQFELSRVQKKGNAFALVLVDDHTRDDVIKELESNPQIQSVTRINL